jgi:general secretion pathway protein N
MRRATWITLLAVVAFVLVLVARMPASWVVPSTAQMACGETGGTLWSGTCVGLTVHGKPSGDLQWELHPSRLLTGKLAAHVVWSHPPGSAQGDVEMGLGKRITLRNLQADIPLDPLLIPQLPQNMSGHARAAVPLARLEKGHVTELQGRIEAFDLARTGPQAAQLGSYSLTFPGGPGEPTGQLRDLGGPLSVQGTVRLTSEPGFDLQALVKARGDAPPDLAHDLQFLGSPDAQGFRPFGLSGTF